MPNTGRAQDDLLPPRAVCEQYPVFSSTQALADLRWRGEGPDYIKTAEGRAGRIFYRRSAIERWLDEHTVRTGGQRAA
ncbi:DNA-binding protein [Streptomyces sp. NPDC101117]|uniref:DNA-binding protein n=1 Tax=Streptomyces sp. NPDC101117 TaxID=3366108 RepID=UPI003806A051